ncbi:SPOR domain-containing protein [Reichenbachiella versicolor]|uniref:SPOR domain-containing protein n=1 Tax=Reichenbachiella versicolor TaxID=1821036 RepID=UPI000D6DF2DD|nr:SPOR domain-containing protein [Reichenbachiella versicolor]
MNKGAIIAVIILVVLSGLVASWYFFSHVPAQEAKEKFRQEQIAKRNAAKKKKERLKRQAEQKRNEYKLIISSADEAFALENWEESLKLYGEALTLFPNEQYPQDQLGIVEEKLEEPEIGTIENITSATGQFYVIVSSSLDGDLAMDYANELSDQGSGSKIIEPYGSNKFYRIAIADYSSLEEAVAAAPSFNTVDGEEAWVLKY